MNRKNLLFLSVLLLLAVRSMWAQTNEASFSMSGIFTTGQNTTTTVPGIACPVTNLNCNIARTHLETDPGIALEGTYARRLVNLCLVSVYAELPFLAVPSRTATASLSNGTLLGDVVGFSSSAFFLTPSARLKLFSSAPISPFVSLGGGWAHLDNHSRSGSTFNGFALQYGAGLDFKSPIPHVGFRAEARDFYSGSGARSSGFTTISPERLHHVLVGGGAVLHF